jgi:hypothetical protein
MADYQRYSNPDRDRYRERGRERQRYENQRPDDQTAYGMANPNAYRSSRGQGIPSAEGGLPGGGSYGGVDRGVGGYGQRRYGGDYGRDDEGGATYGGFEESSFLSDEGRERDYGGPDPYGFRRPSYGPSGRGREPSAWRGNDRHDRESYPFAPYEAYGESEERGRRSEGGGRHRHDRGFWDRTADRVQSMFGDDEAKARLRGDHAGRGPRGYKRSDDRIREDVSDRLSDDSWLDATDIEVMVSETEVTLSGTVADRDAKRRAESLAESVSGVSHVQNNLRVSQHDRPGGVTEGQGEHNSALTRQAAGRA